MRKKKMKSILFIFLSFIIISLFACKKVNNREMIVVHDCTGSYLRFNDKEYRVCNLESVNDFEHETIVKASFNKIDTCTGSAIDVIVCTMLHKNDGWVNVTEIENI